MRLSGLDVLGALAGKDKTMGSDPIGVKITLQYGPSHWINYILSKLHYSTALPAELITGW